jgi:hypothetical protein
MLTKSNIGLFELKNAVANTVSTFSIDPSEFYGPPGKEHYRFLAQLAHEFDGEVIIDIGTHRGSSALALSTNQRNKVHSFDIIEKVAPHSATNLHFHIADLWNPSVREQWKGILLGSKMIVLDIDPHEGTMEFEFYQWLKWSNYKGLLVCDDIWYFKNMRDNFWLKIPSSEKLDVTCLGHWSGTGVVAFSPQPFEFETLLGMRTIGSPVGVENKWTVVTAYFDLTRMPDASASIKARPNTHYLDSSMATLSLEQPMVIFCEASNAEEIKKRRPVHLQSITQICVVDFETLPLTKYRSKIIQNRLDHPYRQDDRNTASYYLLCMARYSLLKRVMEENPFNSTHFSWLNICIERMGYSNLQHLDEIFLGPLRDKVSTVYIDYIPKSLVDDTKQYFEYGRCSLCSGFFTGRADYMLRFCNAIEAKFLEFVEKGYGHADEQLYSPVYFENRDLFEVYYGDYFQMISNYRGMYENYTMPLRLLIPKSAQAGDWETCLNATKWVYQSHQEKKCSMTAAELNQCLYYWREAAKNLGEEEQKKFRTAVQG